jgi:hypothetical protein
MIVRLTGRLPEPVMVIAAETSDTFELQGDSDESVVCEFIAAWGENASKLFDVRKEAECKTRKYGSAFSFFKKNTGIIVPKAIIQEYGIRTNYYLEIVMKKITKGDQTIDVFPKREVFESYPAGFEKVSMK